MNPAPLPLEILGRFFSNWWREFRNQFNGLIDRWIQLLIDTFKGFPTQKLIGEAVDLVTDFIALIGTSMTNALADTIYEEARKLVPPEWGRQVVTRKQATLDCIDLIWRAGVLGFQTTQLPGFVSVSDRMGQLDLVIELAHKRLPRLFQLWKKIFTKLLKWWIRAALVVSRVGLVIALTWLTIRLLQLVEQKQLFKGLSQSNPKTTFAGPVTFRLAGTARRTAGIEEISDEARLQTAMAHRRGALDLGRVGTAGPRKSFVSSQMVTLKLRGVLPRSRKSATWPGLASVLSLSIALLVAGCAWEKQVDTPGQSTPGQTNAPVGPPRPPGPPPPRPPGLPPPPRHPDRDVDPQMNRASHYCSDGKSHFDQQS